jgi:hypothetical protein
MIDRVNDLSKIIAYLKNSRQRQHFLDGFHRQVDKLGEREIGDSDDDVAALVDGDEDALGEALSDRLGHLGRDLPEQRIRDDDADRSDDDIGGTAIDDDGVFPGRPDIRPAFQHIRGRDGVGPDRRDMRVGIDFLDGFDELPSEFPALSVDNDDIRMVVVFHGDP